ncbi:hypothetical protein [Streptomyces sp. NPDC002122]|uniref:hypothetical protein n=1 Tax=Streptomyces sp. NPDC002122 TaxID=3154407 RepID=UPI00331817BD
MLREHRDPLQHHDAHRLDDGHILYAALEPLLGEQAAAVRGGVPGSKAAGGTVWATRSARSGRTANSCGPGVPRTT